VKCCDIKAGDLRNQVSLQRKQINSDGAGGTVVTWVEYATPWCKITPKTGNEKIYLGRLDAQGLSSVTTRYMSTIIESDKLVFKNKEFQIRSIINIEERNKYTEMLIERGVTQ